MSKRLDDYGELLHIPLTMVDPAGQDQEQQPAFRREFIDAASGSVFPWQASEKNLCFANICRQGNLWKRHNNKWKVIVVDGLHPEISCNIPTLGSELIKA